MQCDEEEAEISIHPALFHPQSYSSYTCPEGTEEMKKKLLLPGFYAAIELNIIMTLFKIIFAL